MNLRMFPWIRIVLVVLGWATTVAALTLFTIFNGQLLPKNINGGGLYYEVVNASPIGLWIFYLGSFGTSLLCAMMMSDAGKALICFLPSYIGAAIITFLVLALPDFVGVYDPSQVIQESAVVFTLGAFFPLLLLANFAGTIAGIFLGERWL